MGQPGTYFVEDAVEAEEKLRKVIRAHREKRYASVYKKKMREVTRKARVKK